MMEWLAGWHSDAALLLPLIGGTIGGALAIYLMATTMTACSIPGTIIPLSLTGGLLLGPWLAVVAVAGGALTGSLVLFLLARRFGMRRLRTRFGDRLRPLEARLKRFGPVAVVTLRVAGVPGPLVTAGAALSAMSMPVFAAATLAGVLPSVIIAAAGPTALFG